MTRLFISYAHDDRRLLGNFLKHLDAIGEARKKAGPFSYWFDDDLKGGQIWDERIKAELDGADVFLLFVSPTFMASKYIQETEWPAIAAAREERGALVVPVIARRTHWEAKFGHLQAVPRDARNKLVSIDGWRPANDGHHAAVGQVEAALGEWATSNLKQQSNILFPENFSLRNSVESWLSTRSRAEIIGFGARAALRVLPLIIREFNATSEVSQERTADDLLMSMLRATAIAWVEAKFPNKDLAIDSSLRLATHSATDLVADMAVRATTQVATVVARAAAYASAAARAPAGGAAAYATDAVAYATAGARARAAENAARAVKTSDAGRNSIEGATSPLYDAARADALWLSESRPEKRLIDQPLWLTPFPFEIAESWSALHLRLRHSNEGWDVWGTWYEDRLDGLAADEWLEIQKALIPEATWRRGHRAVNADIKTLISARDRQRAAAKPVGDVAEIQRFTTTLGGAITAEVDGPLPLLPAAGSARDHRQLLKDCRQAGDELLKGLRGDDFNVRKDYADALEAHLKALPKRVGSGNIHTADREARFLLEMMSEDGVGLPSVFAARLRGFLQAHLGLRTYYPEVEAFYHAVQTGKLTLPFPLDAYQGVRDTTADHTPTLFAPSVGHVLAGDRISDAVDAAHAAPEPERPGETPPSPPPLKDPLGELDPTASQSYRRGSMVNSLWRVFLQGDGVARSTEGWIKAADALAPNVARIIEWLSQFRG